MSDALEEIVELYETRKTQPRTMNRNSMRAIGQAGRNGAASLKLRTLLEGRAPVTLPRVKWLERPDP